MTLMVIQVNSDRSQVYDYLEWLEAWQQETQELMGDPTEPYLRVQEELLDAFESGASLEILCEISEHFKARPRT